MVAVDIQHLWDLVGKGLDMTLREKHTLDSGLSMLRESARHLAYVQEGRTNYVYGDQRAFLQHVLPALITHHVPGTPKILELYKLSMDTKFQDVSYELEQGSDEQF